MGSDQWAVIGGMQENFRSASIYTDGMNEARIGIRDLDRMAFLDLRKELGAEHFEADEAAPGDDIHGELLTTSAIIALTPILVPIFAKWILKHRKFDMEVVRKKPGGEEETVKLHFESGGGEKGLLDKIIAALKKAFFGDEAES